MNIDTIIATVGAGVVSIIAVAAMALSIRQSRVTERNLERANAILQRSMKEIDRPLRPGSGLISSERDMYPLIRAMDRLSESMDFSAGAISRQLSSMQEVVHNNYIYTHRPSVDSTQTGLDVSQLIRELSHSLNTPIQHIEVTLARVESLMRTDQGKVLRIGHAQDSVNLCRAVLTAYRDLVGIADSTIGWGIDDLESTLRHALDSIAHDNFKDKPIPEIRVESPQSVLGYSNYYVVALLLPLLQNAVEACPAGGSIYCLLGNKPSLFVVDIKNSVEIMPNFSSMEEIGYTSKGGGHEGLGLSSVRTLVSRYGGKVSFFEDGGLVNVRVELPARP